MICSKSKILSSILSLVLLVVTLFLSSYASDKDKDRPVAGMLKERADQFAAKSTPEMSKVAQQGEKELKASGVLESALKVGDMMPAFELPSADGHMVKSAELDSAIVLVFYRGAWCPYCNVYLSALDDYREQFNELGASLIAVSSEPPDRSLEVAQNDSLHYTVLSDVGLNTARKFGIVYELPEVTDNFLKGFGLDIAKYNESEKAELPLSATYAIDKNGKIIYAFIEADYKLRAEPSDIIYALKKN